MQGFSASFWGRHIATTEEHSNKKPTQIISRGVYGMSRQWSPVKQQNWYDNWVAILKLDWYSKMHNKYSLQSIEYGNVKIDGQNKLANNSWKSRDENTKFDFYLITKTTVKAMQSIHWWIFIFKNTMKADFYIMTSNHVHFCQVKQGHLPMCIAVWSRYFVSSLVFFSLSNERWT